MAGPLSCSFCLFDEAKPPADEADELETVMVINGHSTCLWHASYVQGGDWSLKLAAIRGREQ